MEKNIMDHLETYHFQVDEVVAVGGNPNELGEVTDISGSQIAVRILTPPRQGKTIYTTRFTYYTTPMPHLSAKEVREMYSSAERSNAPVSTKEMVNGPVAVNEETTAIKDEETIVHVMEESIEVVEEELNHVFLEEKEIVAAESFVEDDFMQLSLF